MTLHQALRVIDHTLTPVLESGEMGHSESGENGQF